MASIDCSFIQYLLSFRNRAIMATQDSEEYSGIKTQAVDLLMNLFTQM